MNIKPLSTDTLALCKCCQRCKTERRQGGDLLRQAKEKVHFIKMMQPSPLCHNVRTYKRNKKRKTTLKKARYNVS